MSKLWKAVMAGMLAMWLGSCAASPEPMDLATFDKPDAANHFLVCDPALCRSKPDMTAPHFKQPPERMRTILRRALKDEPRLALIAEEEDAGRSLYVQRSAVFRFPDAVWVQIFPLPDGGSTLGLYSRSTYGRYDFGVNEARLRRWLAAIEAVLAGSLPDAGAVSGVAGSG